MAAITEQGTKDKELYIEYLIKKDLKQLQQDFQMELDRVVIPERQAHLPFVHNDLRPYCDTRPIQFLVDRPDLIKFGFSARPTASGLIDPWEDLSMDRKILPKIQDKPLVTLSPYSSPYSSRKNKKKSTPRGSKEGSTMCPQFPVVTMPVREWETKPLTYNDVPNMRKHLDKVYMKINSKDKTNVEYVRTKQDFYRMDLDKLGELHPSNRGRMKQTYNAYLTNTPGSKQAIQECLKQAAGNSNNSDQSQTQQEMRQQQQEAQ